MINYLKIIYYRLIEKSKVYIIKVLQIIRLRKKKTRFEKINNKVYLKINTVQEDNKFLHRVVSTAIRQIIKNDRKFSIVQIGANDGVTVDPVYPIAKRYKDDTCLLLIEPQFDIVEILKKNYSFHDRATIANIAIGENGGDLILYRIRSDLQKYYKGIIGSGITSANRDYVEKKALKLPKSIIAEEKFYERNTVESFRVVKMRLLEAIKSYNINNFVDWIQIDTEGYDDHILYNSDIERLKPSIISYEISHFSNKQHLNLGKYLDSFGYKRFIFNEDNECAISESLEFNINQKKH